MVANGAAPRRLLLDVTQTSVTPFVSGVQRVVRDFATDNVESVALVRFDPRSDRFVHVSQVPAIRRRPSSGSRAAVRLAMQRIFLLVSRPWRQGRRVGSAHRFPLRNLARSIYIRFLADSYLVEDRRWRRGPSWGAEPGDVLLVMEIPKSQRHLERLRTAIPGQAVLVVYVHDLIPIRHPEFSGEDNRTGLRAEFLSYLDVVGVADRIIANSETTAKEFQHWLTFLRGEEQPRPDVRYPPIPGEWARSRARSAARAVDAAGDPAHLRILGIGALDGRKNLQVVLRAAAILRGAGHRAQVTLVIPKGRTEDGEAVAMIRRLGDAVSIFDGVTDDELSDLYASHGVVVVPSRAEGFGLPVIEGLQHGRPVVASDIEIFRELGRVLPISLARADDAADWARLILAAQEPSDVHIPEGVFPPDWRGLAVDLLSRT